MKFLLCLVFCFVAVQATHVRSSITYAAPYNTYSAGVVPAPAVYTAPLPLAYSAGLAAPVAYSTAGLGIGGHLVKAAYVAPSIRTTVVKKEILG